MHKSPLFSRKPPVRRREPRIAPGTPSHFAVEYLQLFLGLALIAWSFNVFLVPNSIAAGGVVGISTLLFVRFGIEPAVSQWAINIPLLCLYWPLMGAKMGLKTIIGSLLLPVFILGVQRMHLSPLTHDALLASIFGGVFYGIGLGFVFRAESSVGGVSLVAQLAQRFLGVPLSAALSALDCAILVAAALLLNPEKALYALIAVYATRRLIDAVRNGWHFSKTALVISSAPEEVSQAILNDLHRGLTVLQGKGGFTGQDRAVLMVVCSATEIARLKTLVAKHDPDAFIILWDAMEVLGEGFKVFPA
ncbi:YitT family protein [bacterium]|nr:MAG: YitT family protein [bacterium]